MIRTKADGVKVGDVVRRAYDGKPRGVRWKVVEVGERSFQAYWGYWYRHLWVVSESSGRKTMLRTAEVIVVE